MSNASHVCLAIIEGEMRLMRTRIPFGVWAVVVAVGVLLLPATAGAQGGGSISGEVVDNTGGVLPGVTIEVTSSVLIEGTVTAVTDGSGRYTVINLRPGEYAVTFTLPGFGTLIRDDLQVTGDTALQVDGALSVGALEESVTVSGATPLVDVQSVRRQAVVTAEMMALLPSQRGFEARALLIPGVSNDGLDDGAYWSTVHGSETGDTTTLNDGMRATSMIDDGNYRIGWQMNDAATAELTYETGGAPAEAQAGGLAMNAIPKEGGNLFAGTMFTYYGIDALQGNNLTPELVEALGESGDSLAYSIDANPAFGGPLIKDKLWFFAAARWNESKTFIANTEFKTGELGFGHDGEQGFSQNYDKNALLRLTHQLSQQNKWRLSFERNNTWIPYSGINSLSAARNNEHHPPADRLPRASEVYLGGNEPHVGRGCGLHPVQQVAARIAAPGSHLQRDQHV